MSNQTVVDFYEKKYKHESINHDIIKINYSKHPVNRFEATLKYFMDRKFKGSIMELAAGDGALSRALLQNLPDIDSYFATDLSKNRLESIKRNIDDSRLKTAFLDVENFDSETYAKVDSVLMLALIEHLVDPLSAMKNIYHLLKPGGFVYIDTPNVAAYYYRLRLLRGRFPSTSSRDEGLTKWDGSPVDMHDEGHLHYFTYRSLSKMLTEFCGFSKIEKYYFPVGKYYFGKKVHYKLAKINPELFSELVLLAYK